MVGTLILRLFSGIFCNRKLEFNNKNSASTIDRAQYTPQCLQYISIFGASSNSFFHNKIFHMHICIFQILQDGANLDLKYNIYKKLYKLISRTSQNLTTFYLFLLINILKDIRRMTIYVQVVQILQMSSRNPKALVSLEFTIR